MKKKKKQDFGYSINNIIKISKRWRKPNVKNVPRPYMQMKGGIFYSSLHWS